MQGKKISSTIGKAQIEAITAPLIIKKNIESYEIVNTRTAGQTSVKGIFDVGFSKAHVVYQISLMFKKGKKCLIEVDEDLYKVIQKELF